MARATQNELFLVMLDSISDVLLEVRTRGFSSGDTIAYAHAAHREILDRVVARDAAGARAAMEAHVAESERRLRPPK
jgi:DNA-binding FadR family transcriptional regulator